MKRSHLIPVALIIGIAFAGCDLASLDPGGGAYSTTVVTMRSTETPTDTGPEPPGPDPGEEGSKDPGSFTGVIKFDGSFGGLNPLVPQGTSKVDPTICAKDGAIPDESLVVGNGNGIANVFVYLQRAPKRIRIPSPGDQTILDQKGCIFIPHAIIWRVGEEFDLKNSDNASHNISAKPNSNDSFNENLAPGSSTTRTYSKADREPFPSNCAIHSWMKYYTLVLDHPWAAITDAEGRFEIKELPPGDYSFRVWQERAGFLEGNLKVTIQPGAPTEIELSYDSAAFKL